MNWQLLVCSGSIAPNDLSLYEGGELEVLNPDLPQK
mgnify:CR=1 FL=1